MYSQIIEVSRQFTIIAAAAMCRRAVLMGDIISAHTLNTPAEWIRAIFVLAFSVRLARTSNQPLRLPGIIWLFYIKFSFHYYQDINTHYYYSLTAGMHENI
ncbi:hypothetical protein R8O61_003180 [Klebsiella oxytoca]|nr:hypothetical protein [Klebsiella oxytoca]